jgi:hypothetical protein
MGNLFDKYRPTSREAVRSAEDRAGTRGMPESRVKNDQGVKGADWAARKIGGRRAARSGEGRRPRRNREGHALHVPALRR